MIKISIKIKNLEYSETLNLFVNKKFLMLEKFIEPATEIIVEIEKETNHHKKGDIFRVKGQVIFEGKNIVSDEIADDLFKAVTQAKNELKMEIEKYKVKRIDKNRRVARKSKEELKI